MGLQAVSLSHEDYTLFSGISTAISRSSGLQFRQSARAYRFATEILVFFRHQFRTCRSEHRHHSAISLCALPLVQIFERTFTALRYITVFGPFRSIGITSSYAFSIRGNGFPIKEFYFLNLENLNMLISHIMTYIFCVLYRTPYDFKDRPLCPHCLSIPLIFLEMPGADFGDTFQQSVRIFGGHREKYRLIFVL